MVGLTQTEFHRSTVMHNATRYDSMAIQYLKESQQVLLRGQRRKLQRLEAVLIRYTGSLDIKRYSVFYVSKRSTVYE